MADLTQHLEGNKNGQAGASNGRETDEIGGATNASQGKVALT